MKDLKSVNTLNIGETITPTSYLNVNFKSLWSERDLLWDFAIRHIKVKYKQTFIGILWVVIQPLLLSFVFVFFFSKTLNLGTDGMPPIIFYLSGLLLWNFFNSGAINGSNSLIINDNLIKKLYFPRVFLPFSTIILAGIDFLVSLVVFIFIATYHSSELEFGLQGLLYLPLSLLIIMLTTAGISMIFSSINIKYRDVNYILPFMLQLLFFISPIIYSRNVIENDIFIALNRLNPIGGAITIFRSIFTDVSLSPITVLIPLLISAIIFMVGWRLFKKAQLYLSDLL